MEKWPGESCCHSDMQFVLSPVAHLTMVLVTEMVEDGYPLGNRLPLGSQLSLVTHCAFNISACDLDGDEDGETVEIRRLLVDLLPLGAEHCLVKWLLTRCWCF